VISLRRSLTSYTAHNHFFEAWRRATNLADHQLARASGSGGFADQDGVAALL